MPRPYRPTFLKMKSSTYEEEALKALNEEHLARSTPEGIAKRAKMLAQERIIMSAILFGEKTQLDRLDIAYKDPELDPEVKTLIETCFDKARFFNQRISEEDKRGGESSV